MSDRPILFSAPMVRALLDGRKTQTRRVLKPQPEQGQEVINLGREFATRCLASGDYWGMTQPRFIPGDRLWVKETWVARMTHGWTIADARSRMFQEEIIYRADDNQSIDGWWPSLFMPREFSRLTLLVTDVRVQRLQDISGDDAVAEGIEFCSPPPRGLCGWRDYGEKPGDMTRRYFRNPVSSFCTLWNSINGPDAWAANPWVAAISFDVVRGNIEGKLT